MPVLGVRCNVAISWILSWLEWTPWKRARAWSRRSEVHRSNPPNRDKGDLRNRMKRVIARSLVMGLGDGVVRVDAGYLSATDLKVGLFTSTDGF